MACRIRVLQSIAPPAISIADAQKRVPPRGARTGRVALPRDRWWKNAWEAVANLVVRHGTGMPAWKLSILANYIVSRKADPNTPVAEA